ncbi:hypothetical protein N7493_000890 [Penicillium malachiteum]|uniref:BZIP domain-containing protein n=1 Tax=Penicillium malachiteum TaxID=1324776 RepID=A0AAD6HXW0_9EURO|nr:hypothetical protein N7493_000890 [Penicillium malachiteum]
MSSPTEAEQILDRRRTQNRLAQRKRRERLKQTKIPDESELHYSTSSSPASVVPGGSSTILENMGSWENDQVGYSDTPARSSRCGGVDSSVEIIANDWSDLLSTLGESEGDTILDSNDQMLGGNGQQENMMTFDPPGGDKSKLMVSELKSTSTLDPLSKVVSSQQFQKALSKEPIPPKPAYPVEIQLNGLSNISSSPMKIPSAAYRDILEGDNGMTALHLCVSNGDFKAVVMLLDCGINVHAVDSQKRTALHIACIVGNVEIVALLLQASTQTEVIDCNGYTPLHIACRNGSYEIIKTLFKAGADLNARVGDCIYPMGDCPLSNLFKIATAVVRFQIDSDTPVDSALDINPWIRPAHHSLPQAFHTLVYSPAL